MKQRRKAFSLLETLLVVTLMGIVAAVGLVNTRTGASRGQAAGLAEVVAEELRGARFRAISQNVPVAVVFPSGGGTAGHSQSLYVLEGLEKPHLARSSDFKNEYTDSRIFVGTWSTTSTLSRDDMQVGAQGQQFSLENWGLPIPDDYAILFTPAGTVKTNGLPQFNGQYHLVVGSGLTSSPAAIPAGAQATRLKYFQLDSVAMPTTIGIAASGAVCLQDGIPEGSAVRVERQTIANSGGASLVLPGAPSANQNPLIKASRFDSGQTTPFNIYPGSQISMVVEATDPDGDPLFVRFYTKPGGQGKFSSSTPTRMEWVPNPSGPGYFRANWVWTPPEGLGSGSAIELYFDVTDGKGGSVTGNFASGTSSDRGTGLAFTVSSASAGGGAPESEVGTSATDGSGLTIVSTQGDKLSSFGPLFSPDGKKLSYYAGMGHIMVAYADGAGARSLGDTFGGVQWAPDSMHLIHRPTMTSGIVSLDVQTKVVQSLTQVADDGEESCSVVPIDGDYRVLFVRPGTGICSVRLSDGTDFKVHVHVAGWNRSAHCPSWSPDGTKIIYAEYNWAGPTDTVWIHDLASGSRTKLQGPANSGSFSPYFSPDGNYVLFTEVASYDGLRVIRADGRHPDDLRPGVSKLVIASRVIGDWCCSPDSKEIVSSNLVTGTLQIDKILGPTSTRIIKGKNGKKYAHPNWSRN